MTKEKYKAIQYHYPTKTPDGEGGWKDAHTPVGKVTPDGKIEGTDYKFKRRGIRGGGVAYTTHSELARTTDGKVVNPATGEEFVPTRSGKGLFSRVSRVFVPPKYHERETK